MSILGKWFKKDEKKRLESQIGKESDLGDAEKDSSENNMVLSDEGKTTNRTSSKKQSKKNEKEKTQVSEPSYISEILLQARVTEKAAHVQGDGVYTFLVAPRTSKNEIAKAIKRTYNVVPEKIRVMNVRGKTVRWGKFQGQRSHFKKAMVFLKKGDVIVIHEGT